MKEAKRVIKALDTLDTIVSELEYFYGPRPEFKKFIRDEVSDLVDLVKELSVDQKISNRRLALKLKAMWDQENDQ